MSELNIPDALPILSAGHHDIGTGRACVMDGCERPVRRHRDGVCNAHRQQIRLEPLTDEDRFWARVEKSDDCWTWTGSRFSTGYGMAQWQGKQRPAHRVSLMIRGIDLPVGMDVCHHCDNPPCVRPEHLYVGTRKQNMADCTARGRHNKLSGEASPIAKVSDRDVSEMRRLYADGATQAVIGADFNLHPSTVSRIVRNVWRAA